MPKSNVIYVGINPNLNWIEGSKAFEITEESLLKKNIKPWKSKCGQKVMYQLYNPVTKSRVVYTRPNAQEPLIEGTKMYQRFFPETDDQTAKMTELRIINKKI